MRMNVTHKKNAQSGGNRFERKHVMWITCNSSITQMKRERHYEDRCCESR